MADIKLYGISGSRAIRSIWAIEEVGIAYDHIATHFINDSKTEEYLGVNPNGRIPALVDGEFVLCESMAINLYLAQKYGGALYPATLEQQAQANQWSVWAISEIEPLQMQIVVQKFFTPDDKKNPTLVEQASRGLERPLKVLDDHLATRQYLLGDEFSIADLNVAGVMLLLQLVEFEISGFSNVQAWAGRCYSRPSLAAAQARD